MKIRLIDDDGALVGEFNATGTMDLTAIPAEQEPVDPVDPEPEVPPPVAEPVPEPEPEPIEDHEPADPTERPPSIVRQINLSRQLVFRDYNDAKRYERWQKLVVLKGEAASLQFLCTKSGGGLVSFLSTEYRLLCDGEHVATVQVSSGASRATFELDLSSIAEGWHVFDIVGHDHESGVFMPMYVLKGEVAEVQEWMPVYSGSTALNGHTQHELHWVPAKFEPTIQPAPKRPKYEHFSNATSRSNLFRETLVCQRGGNITRPNVSKEDIINTMNRQWYTYGDFTGALPKGALLDGPKGRGNLAGPTHVEIGVATTTDDPTSPPRNNCYVLDSWRMVRVGENGHITTLVGYRHSGMASYFEDHSNVELVGDWSAVPEDRRGFHETWGMCWDSSTLEVDPNGPTSPEEENRPPHFVAPVAFIADSQNNRIVRVEFNAHVHDIPPKVTEFLAGIPDAWDVVEYRKAGSIIVSERGAHRVCQYDIKTGELQRVILQGAALSTVSWFRLVQRNASLDAIRAQPVVGPEGLYIMDDWLYIGSVAMAQVIRVHLETGERQVVVNYGSGMNNYLKIAVSDGTFGPRHSVFITAWSVEKFGGPAAFSYDGTGWSSWGLMTNGDAPRGPGGAWVTTGYNAAVAVRNGRLVYGGSAEGLWVLSRKLPTDEAVDLTKYRAGASEINNYLYGPQGYGYYGLPLPWGQSEAMDYYLTCNGHARGGE